MCPFGHVWRFRAHYRHHAVPSRSGRCEVCFKVYPRFHCNSNPSSGLPGIEQHARLERMKTLRSRIPQACCREMQMTGLKGFIRPAMLRPGWTDGAWCRYGDGPERLLGSSTLDSSLIPLQDCRTRPSPRPDPGDANGPSKAHPGNKRPIGGMTQDILTRRYGTRPLFSALTNARKPTLPRSPFL
jgi:hypothetical protein